MVLGLDMRFLGGKWQKKIQCESKGNGISCFDPSSGWDRRGMVLKDERRGAKGFGKGAKGGVTVFRV
jgi:hypothetical protein